jgi:rubrerythrin
MLRLLPEHAPSNVEELTAHIYAASPAEIDTLRMMALLEASGQGLYEDLALLSESHAVSALLRKNAQEEVGHAHRLTKAIRILGGLDYEVPVLNDNIYYQPKRYTQLSVDLLVALAASEKRGANLYLRWADSIVHKDVIKLFQLSAREEFKHCARLEEASKMIAER